MKYPPPKQISMQNFVSIVDKYGAHKHLGAYTLINVKFFKVQNRDKKQIKKPITE